MEIDLRRIEASEEPLSADVCIICHGDRKIIYDVGRSDATYKELSGLIDDKSSIVISHFHPDHMENLKRLLECELYLGKNTYKYCKRGNIVEESVLLDREADIEVITFPSSHAKGCLALRVGTKYLLIGDGIYPRQNMTRREYNVQQLKSQIDLLEGLDVELIGISHNKSFFKPKDRLLGLLKGIYRRREPGENVILAPNLTEFT